jgi:DNA mismatch repair ATPase MutS
LASLFLGSDSDWIQRPLVKAAQIRARQDAIEFLLRASASPMHTLDAAGSWIKAVTNSMETSDLERLVASVHFLRASPKRLLQLLRSSQTYVAH